jgi:hypothetical protein
MPREDVNDTVFISSSAIGLSPMGVLGLGSSFTGVRASVLTVSASR